MVVFGTLKTENSGKILFRSEDIEECRKYANSLDDKEYYELSICEDNGIIKERIVITLF